MRYKDFEEAIIRRRKGAARKIKRAAERLLKPEPWKPKPYVPRKVYTEARLKELVIEALQDLRDSTSAREKKKLRRRLRGYGWFGGLGAGGRSNSSKRHEERLDRAEDVIKWAREGGMSGTDRPYLGRKIKKQERVKETAREQEITKREHEKGGKTARRRVKVMAECAKKHAGIKGERRVVKSVAGHLRRAGLSVD